MDDIYAIIEERGQGFPSPGELIGYDYIYRVVEVGMTVHDPNPTMGRGTRRYATLEEYGDPFSISEDEFDQLRNVRILEGA